MKITKYEHACLVIEDSGKRLVIDPGEFANSLPALSDVVAVVITHVHFDHFNKERLQQILDDNPDAKVISTGEVSTEFDAAMAEKPNMTCEIAPFKLEFFGGQHAIIHPDYPKFENLGVLVNDRFYYGGDSLNVPDKPVEVLAVPVSGPWSKTEEQLDYMAAVKPKVIFPTHDALNSEAGNASQDRWFSMHAKKRDMEYRRLAVGEVLEI
jgi:L-ascorbate metabolism protein UlaG (beta-lactamase superfamily)